MEQRLVDKKTWPNRKPAPATSRPPSATTRAGPHNQIREDVYLTDGQIHPRCEHATFRCAEEPPPAL